MKKDISVVILAAGESRRMMKPKPFLKFDNQNSFIDKIVKEYQKFECEEIIIVTNAALVKMLSVNEEAKLIVNEHPEYGRFFSIKCGLKSLEKPKDCFIQNVDNPFVNLDLLELIYNHKDSAECIIPSVNGNGGHPIIIGKKVIDEILSFEENEMNLRDVLKEFDCKKIETGDDSVLININNPEDYRRYFN